MLQTEKTLSWILKGGLLLTPFLVFVVTRSLYFPFITGKNFAFRILMEILAAIWVYAALKFPSFRPHSSAVLWSVAAFIGVLGAAAVFGLSPYRSFWSNFERMEGYIGLLHLFLYFILLIGVFRTERDWRAFFYTTVGASALAAVYALFQLAGAFTIHQGGTRVDATLGNATYFAAYLVFHLFFILWFLLRAKTPYGRISLAALFLLELAMLYYTATRGSMIGLFGGLVILATLLAAVERGFLRRLALGGLGALILLPMVFFAVRGTGFVRNSDVLSRFTAISPQETTTQARFTIWSMALRGWRERPILGWGQESFVYVFSKHYEPSLWRQEPWFDRAHNVFLDWLTAGGVLGLAAYLSMFATAAWLIFAARRRNSVDSATAVVMFSLLAAHFFQILFVFDNLTSYLLFFAVLAYVHTLDGKTGLPAGRQAAPAVYSEKRAMVLPAGFAEAGGAAALVAFLLFFYFANVKPILAARSILKSLQLNQTHEPAGKVDALIAAFRKGIALNTSGTMEIREQISQVAGALIKDQSIANQDKGKFLSFAIDELEAERTRFPSDVRAKAFLATIYSAAGRPNEAIEVVNESLAISDRRQQFYFVAAEAYLNAGQNEQAVQALRRAYELAPDYPEAISNLATVLIIAGKETEAESFLEKNFGKRLVAEKRYANAYAQRGSFPKAVVIWKEIIARNPADARSHAELGSVYAQAGQASEAIREIEEAIRLEPGFKSRGEQIIRAIREGRTR